MRFLQRDDRGTDSPHLVHPPTGVALRAKRGHQRPRCWSRHAFACNDLTMSVAGHQTLRVLAGSYVLDRPADVTDVDLRADVLAVVFGPDGSKRHADSTTVDDSVGVPLLPVAMRVSGNAKIGRI